MLLHIMQTEVLAISKSTYVLIPPDTLVGRDMHAFQVQQLQSLYILGHHNVKVCSYRQAE